MKLSKREQAYIWLREWTSFQWLNAREIAERAGLDRRSMADALQYALNTTGEVECARVEKRSVTGSGYWTTLWRKLPAGSVRPLYDSNPYVDFRPLAQALCGYSYFNNNTMHMRGARVVRLTDRRA